MNGQLIEDLRSLRNRLAHGSPVDLENALSELGLDIPQHMFNDFQRALNQIFSAGPIPYLPPKLLLDTITMILANSRFTRVCDPWAGFGVLLGSILEVIEAERAVAIAVDNSEAAVGTLLVPESDWRVTDPRRAFDNRPDQFDLVCNLLPFGLQAKDSIIVEGPKGKSIEVKRDIGQQILVTYAKKLSSTGLGLFLVPGSFFFSRDSVLKHFDDLGLGVEAAFSMPTGTLNPYTGIRTYLLLVRNRPVADSFVAQLTRDPVTNRQVIANYQSGTDGASVETGKLLDIRSFRGIESTLTTERLEDIEKRDEIQAIPLELLATGVVVGRRDENFSFPSTGNGILVPLQGNGLVVDESGRTNLQKHLFAHVSIDPTHSKAQFVLAFLNSELGKDLRKAAASGGATLRLRRQALLGIPVLVPALETQQAILSLDGSINAQIERLVELQSQLMQVQIDLWDKPSSVPTVRTALAAFTDGLSVDLRRRADGGMERWFETLPFPLASILRAWQATASSDHKAKHDHLLHFFEAAVQFSSLILLSAFHSDEEAFETHRMKLKEILERQHLSWERATFGTWKAVFEYLSRQTRLLLEGNDEARTRCSELFSDPTLELPKALAKIELTALYQAANKKRNDWAGHSGILSEGEAAVHNEVLWGMLRDFREVTADVWDKAELLQAVSTRTRRTSYETELAVLTGSNSAFRKESREMSVAMYVDSLYIGSPFHRKALELLPLMEMGESPNSARNACYFFNRIEKQGARFVSYHYADEPEMHSSEALSIIAALTKG